MKSLFEAIAEPVRTRMALYDKIEKAFEYVNRNKIVTMIDFDDCFVDSSRHASGRLGFQYFQYDVEIKNALSQNKNRGVIPGFDLPASLANTQTRDAVLKHSNIQHPHLRAYYLGHILDTTDEYINLSSHINRAIIFGEGQQVLEIVKRMQSAPDYSRHFPGRPPGPGEGKKSADKKPLFNPTAVPQPLRF